MHDRAEISDLAEAISVLAQHAGVSVGCAESLTSGQIATALGAAPDASSWFRGGIIAYASEVKYRVLSVPIGPVVTAAAAEQMDRKAAELLNADVTVAVTGVGGPDEQDGQPVGTVFITICAGERTTTEAAHFDREATEILQLTVIRTLQMLYERLLRIDVNTGPADFASVGNT